MSTYDYGYVGLLSDHPSAGPTGPQVAGLGYPSTRATHTLFFGNDGSPLCPGVPLDDGVGTVELPVAGLTPPC